jgi:TolB-like protein/Tfp pilus assembly protein PilF
MGATEQLGEGKGRRLDSWKSIAQHLGREVRSVQRWERERGLPVYRVPGQKGGVVFAYEGELDQWLRSRPADAGDAAPETVPLAATAARSARRRPVIAWLGGVLVVILLGVLVSLRQQQTASPTIAPDASIAPAADRPSLAVLPMQNLSGNPAQDYFADGFTDELITELAGLHSLRVVSSSAAMTYKGSTKPPAQIARELHVKLLFEGSVARDGQDVRVTGQLLDAASGTVLSAHTYRSQVKDVFDIQRQIAAAIADDIRLNLSPAEKARLAATAPVDPKALDLYLQGRYDFAKQTLASIRQSLELFRAAAARAPSFAAAYVGIAEAEASLGQITAQSPIETYRSETDALHKALAIDPHLGDARGMLASLDYVFNRNWPEAERQFRLALAEGAQAPTEQRFGSYLITRGRFEEGMAHLQAGLEKDPVGQSPRVNLFFGLYFQRKYGEARREMESVLARNPDFLAGHGLIELAAVMQHDCSTADRHAAWFQAHYRSPLADFLLSLAAACHGDRATARQLLERAQTEKGKGYASPYQMALGYVMIGDNATALSFLEKSAEQQESQVFYLKVDPMFDPMRADPRFITLEKKQGLL